VAIETGDTLFGVFAQLVFMDDGILKVSMAFGTLAAGTHERRVGLLDLHPGAA